ncbi:hypothetical protein M514_16430 [Trichuris suis]|uniref:Uncharacterized protein n=1 Tax=Trichuris suis TaxID=68888 RepID=A0A085NPV2_9BILA|nr:hypothetical protein M513_06368 [Trichuris suis]KFD52713.1 hypothetical protein M513_06369 [Trichuris suis]KFD71498.1 hypothetical protein M514_16430 [Trichuris suis]
MLATVQYCARLSHCHFKVCADSLQNKISTYSLTWAQIKHATSTGRGQAHLEQELLNYLCKEFFLPMKSPKSTEYVISSVKGCYPTLIGYPTKQHPADSVGNSNDRQKQRTLFLCASQRLGIGGQIDKWNIETQHSHNIRHAKD